MIEPLAELRRQREADETALAKLKARNRALWRLNRIMFGLPALLFILWAAYRIGYETGLIATCH